MGSTEKHEPNCIHEWIPARLVLYLMCLSGIAITFMNRIIMNLTILAMVKERPMSDEFNSSETLCYTSVNNNRTSVAIDYGGTLDWSTDRQYYILTSVYWAYIPSQVLAGIVAQKYGMKTVFGLAMLVSSVSNLLIPITSNIHYGLVILFQVINGLSQGFTWPAIYSAIGHWIPIQERSRFVSCFQGLSLGSALAHFLSGFIIAKVGWVHVFYFSGFLGVICSLLWYYLVYDTPESHPRISTQELYYIQQNKDQTLHSDVEIPWISILTSVPVWMIAIVSFGRMWVTSIYLVYGPLFLKTVLGFDVGMNGLLSGITSFLAYGSSVFFSFISDQLGNSKIVSLASNRKIFATIGHIIPGVLVIAIGHLNCNMPLIITIWVFTQMMSTASFAGPMTNIVDVAPSYTAPVSSLVQTVLLIPTVLSTYVVKTLLQQENIILAWRSIFYISSAVTLVTYALYVLFASTKVQPWDRKKSSKESNDHKRETELLKN